MLFISLYLYGDFFLFKTQYLYSIHIVYQCNNINNNHNNNVYNYNYYFNTTNNNNFGVGYAIITAFIFG